MTGTYYNRNDNVADIHFSTDEYSIDELNQIVASSSSTMDEKVSALEMIANKKKLNKEEQILKHAIKNFWILFISIISTNLLLADITKKKRLSIINAYCQGKFHKQDSSFHFSLLLFRRLHCS